MSNQERNNSLPIRSAPVPPSRGSGLTGMELDTYRIYQNLNSQEEFNSDGGGGFSMRNICYSLFRHKLLIVSCCLLSMMAVCVYLALIEPTYRSNAQVMIRGGNPNLVLNPTGGSGNLVQSSQQFGHPIRQEWTILAGPRIAEMVVEKIGPEIVLARPAPAETAPPSDPSIASPSGETPAEPAEPGLVDRSIQTAQGLLIGAITNYYKFVNRNNAKLTLDQKAARYIQKNIEVRETMDGAFVLQLGFTAYSPVSAQMVLQEFVDSYLEYHLEINKNRVDSAILEHEVETLETQLALKETELDQLREKLNVTSLEEQRAEVLATKTGLSATLNEIQYGIEMLESRIDFIIKSLENLDENEDSIITEAAAASPHLIAAREQLVQLELQMVGLKSVWDDSSRTVQTQQKQIDDVKDRIANLETNKETVTTSAGANPVRESLIANLQNRKEDLVAEEARREAIAADVDELEKELATLNAHSPQYNRLTRDIAKFEIKIQELETDISASKMGDLMDEEKISNLEILVPATLPLRSASTARKTLAICAFLLFMGLAAGIGAAFGLDYLNHSLRTNDEVEQWLGLPVLVSLPKTKEHRPQLREELP